MSESPPRARREMRLLLATIVVSAGMLLLLARFRFPEEAAREPVEPAAAPLERLAAKATYDELASIMGDLERRLSPSVIAVGIQEGEFISYVPAVRVTADRAVAVVGAGGRLAAATGSPTPEAVARDTTRGLVVMRTAPAADAVVAFPSSPPRPGPRYIAVVEAAGGAPVVRPVYVGRTDLVSDPRWSESVLSVAAIQQTVTNGAAMFSLDGSFVGLVSDNGGTVTVIPGNILRAFAESASPGAAGGSELPIEIEALTPALGRAAGADKGVIVSFVPDAIRSATDLAAGDVIRSIDGNAVTTVTGLLQVVHSTRPGTPLKLDIVRRGKPLSATISTVAAGAAQRLDTAARHGIVLRPVAGIGAEVIMVRPGSPGERAGLRRGDLIVSIDSHQAPDSSRIDRAFAAARSGDTLLMTVLRDSDHRVLALEKQ